MTRRSSLLLLGVALWVVGWLASFTLLGTALFAAGSASIVGGLALFVRDRGWL